MDNNVVIEASTDGLPVELPDEPMLLAQQWFQEAIDSGTQRNPTAMTLVSVGDDNQPSARVVLCKQFVADPGYLVFYTNYESRKGEELDCNPQAAALFHWDAFGRQIRIEALAVRSPADESDDYFASRGWGSQLGAWGSDQSRPVASRQALVEQIRQRAEKLGLSLADGTETLADGKVPNIPRPPHWGGIRLWATAVELWKEGTDRIHDRARWTRLIEATTADQFEVSAWCATRLQP
jgi:pyridoxamine 5'-phosphate oxidase